MDNKTIVFTPEFIAQQRAICDAATPGPWTASLEEENCFKGADGKPIIYPDWYDQPLLCASDEDVAFVCASSAGYRAALDALEAAQKEVERLTAMNQHNLDCYVAENEKTKSVKAEKDKEIEWLKQQLENQAKR